MPRVAVKSQSGVGAGCVAVTVSYLLPLFAQATSPAEIFCRQETTSWSDATTIRPDRPWASEFVDSYDRVQERIEALIDESRRKRDTRSAENIANLYEAAIHAGETTRPLDALSGTLRKIAELKSSADLASLIAAMGRQHRDLIEGSVYPAPAPFLVSVWIDDSDTGRNMAVLTHSGLGLPGREYYLDKASPLAIIRQGYLQQIRGALDHLGGQASDAVDVLRFETEIARLQWSSTQLQDRTARMKVKLGELQRLAPGFDWTVYFDETGLSRSNPISLREPAYVAQVIALFRATPRKTIQNYFRWQLLRHYAPYLGQEIGQPISAFYEQSVLGMKEASTPKQIATTVVETYLVDSLVKLYLDKYFSEGSKLAVMSIAEDVRAAFIEQLRASEWLSGDSKAEAIDKIKRLNIEVAYPEQIGHRTQAMIEPGDLVISLMALSDRAHREQIAKLNQTARRNEWWMSPLSVNASYSQTANTLIIPAGRLQPPMFDAAASDETNFGGVGTLIGHEMGHAIDNQGRQYDARGLIRNWWSETGAKSFEERTNRLVQQYASYEPLPNEHLDGFATLSENIADLVGLTVAHKGLILRKHGDIESDSMRRFLSAWARRWRVKYSDPLLLRVIKSDTHAPYQYRCSGPLENFAPFYDAINVPRPANLLSIW
jgi:predicted metalloendopeptidase